MVVVEWICVVNILIRFSYFEKDSFYRGLTPEESERVHEYNFDHPGNFLALIVKACFRINLV